MTNFITFLCNRVINNEPNSDNAYFKIREVKCRLKTNNGKSSAKTELNKLIENAPSNVGINRRGKRFYGDVSQRSKRSKSDQTFILSTDDNETKMLNQKVIIVVQK